MFQQTCRAAERGDRPRGEVIHELPLPAPVASVRRFWACPQLSLRQGPRIENENTAPRLCRMSAVARHDPLDRWAAARPEPRFREGVGFGYHRAMAENHDLTQAMARLDALTDWERRPRTKMRVGLEPMQDLAARLGDPQKSFRVGPCRRDQGQGVGLGARSRRRSGALAFASAATAPPMSSESPSG